MNAFALTSMAAVSTTIGGSCAIVLPRRMHLLMGFGAGVLVGTACLNLIPAALATAAAHGWAGRLVFEYAILGAVLFFYIRRNAEQHATRDKEDRTAGRMSAGVLVVHSALDGAAIFAASTISIQMGLIVGLGVVGHDLSDGLNTVLLSTGGGIARWEDYGFLALDAAAPIAGGLIASSLFSVSPTPVMLFLSLAAGSFLFTATVGLFPEACRRGRGLTAVAAACAGFLFSWGLTRGIGLLA